MALTVGMHPVHRSQLSWILYSEYVVDAHANSSHFLDAIDIKCINPFELFREQWIIVNYNDIYYQETDNK